MLEYQFQCQECGYIATWTMEDVMDKGTPICGTLDCEYEGVDLEYDGIASSETNLELQTHLKNVLRMAHTFMEARQSTLPRDTGEDLILDECTKNKESIQVVNELIRSISTG